MMGGQYYFHRQHMPHLNKPMVAAFLYDRSQQIFPRPEIATLMPLGDQFAPQVSFAELVERRATHILKMIGDSPIAVSWSGGLDSTCVLAALYDKIDLSRLTVLMNQDSIDEYPWFYERFIKDRVKTAEMSRFSVEIITDQMLKAGNVVISGEIGDQLFGSMAYLDHPDQNDLLAPWSVIKVGVSEESAAIYDKIAAACPVPMTTLKMFYWWMNYCLKYQGVQMRMILSANDAVLEKNVFHFFDGKDFNDYALYTDIETKYPGTDPRHYKLPMKKYIYSVLKDEDYFVNKIKVPSLQLTHGRLWQAFLPRSIDINWKREYN